MRGDGHGSKLVDRDTIVVGQVRHQAVVEEAEVSPYFEGVGLLPAQAVVG